MQFQGEEKLNLVLLLHSKKTVWVQAVFFSMKLAVDSRQLKVGS